VNPAEVDLSEGKIFDEEDRLKAALAAQNGDINEKTRFDPVRTLKNLVFG
jgi:amino acid transporter